jgi:hypothetical protein
MNASVVLATAVLLFAVCCLLLAREQTMASFQEKEAWEAIGPLCFVSVIAVADRACVGSLAGTGDFKVGEVPSHWCSDANGLRGVHGQDAPHTCYLDL